MIASWMSPYLSGQYLYARDKEIEKALSNAGYDMETACQLMREGRMVWYRGVDNRTLEDINVVYLDGHNLFEIIGQYRLSGPWFERRISERETKKDAHI